MTQERKQIDTNTNIKIILNNMEKNHSPIHHLSKRLQNEIDGILSDVDEKKLYAEFRENEIFDIQCGDKQQVVRHTLDERIMLACKSSRSVSLQRIESTTMSAAQKITGASKLFYNLFKPLQY